MRVRRSTLTYAILFSPLLAGISAQLACNARAEECINKPTAKAPPGQHWYYRVDHANNRQCWRIGPEGLLVSKSAPHFETQPAPSPPEERSTATTPASTTETAQDINVAQLAPTPWLVIPTLLNAPPSSQPTARAELQAATTIDSAAPTSNKALAGTDDDRTFARSDAKVSQQTVTRPLHSAEPVPAIVDVDRTIAQLIVMIIFMSLAVAGLIHAYTKRRQTLAANKLRCPQWVPVVALNRPTPRVRAPVASTPEMALARAPHRSPDKNERLRHALQQVVEQLKMSRQPEPSIVSYSAQLADIEIMKGAR